MQVRIMALNVREDGTGNPHCGSFNRQKSPHDDLGSPASEVEKPTFHTRRKGKVPC